MVFFVIRCKIENSRLGITLCEGRVSNCDLKVMILKKIKGIIILEFLVFLERYRKMVLKMGCEYYIEI